MDNISIEVDDKIPSFTFKTADINEDGTCSLPRDIKSSDRKSVVLIGLPGAFTPTCTLHHLPPFIDAIEKLRDAGYSTVAIVSVNDAYVMAHWSRNLGADGKMLMLSDGNGTFTKLIGMELDARHYDMGIRSRRYVMIVKDGIVKYLGVDEGKIENSSLSAVLNWR